MASDVVSLDCSLLAHALIPSQRTDEAATAFARLMERGANIVATPAVYFEFASLLLKQRNQQALTDEDIEDLYQSLLAITPTITPLTPASFERAWAVARSLAQSDIFDAAGYAAAEAHGGEFWTSDRRFANAAANRGLSGIVFVP